MKHTMTNIEFCDIDGNDHFGRAEFTLDSNGDINELVVYSDEGDIPSLSDIELDTICDTIKERLGNEAPKIPDNERLRAIVMATVGRDGESVQATDKLFVNPGAIGEIEVGNIISAYACIAAAAYSACFSAIQTAMGKEQTPKELREIEAGFWDAVEQTSIMSKDTLVNAWKALENQRAKDPSVNYSGKVFRALRAAQAVVSDHDNAGTAMAGLEEAMAQFEPGEFDGF